MASLHLDKSRAQIGQPAVVSRAGAAILMAVVLSAALFSTSCGYQVAGKSAHLPSEWKTIAIPAFTNDTTRYRIEQRLTAAVIREFISRTKYRIVQNPEAADAVLHGEVLTVETSPVLFNGTTGEVTTMLVTVTIKVELVDNQTQKAVYKNDAMVFRSQYQISADVQSFFQEEDPALGRMSHDFAAQIVSNIMENF